MCSGGDKLRNVDSGEAAYRSGNASAYRAAGGLEGDTYRSRIAALISPGSPVADLGIFETRDYDPTGAANLRHGAEASNPFYAKIANKQDRTRRQASSAPSNPFAVQLPAIRLPKIKVG